MLVSDAHATVCYMNHHAFWREVLLINMLLVCCRGQKQVLGILVSVGCNSGTNLGRLRADRAIYEPCNCKTPQNFAQRTTMVTALPGLLHVCVYVFVAG